MNPKLDSWSVCLSGWGNFMDRAVQKDERVLWEAKLQTTEQRGTNASGAAGYWPHAYVPSQHVEYLLPSISHGEGEGSSGRE